MSNQSWTPLTLRIDMSGGEQALLFAWLDAALTTEAVPATQAHAMHIVLEEAVQNVAMHAYPEGEPGEVRVTLQFTPDALVLIVEDDGHPFDPTAAVLSDPVTRLHEPAPGGLGFPLLRHFCRDLRYERAGTRNRLILRFPVPSPADPHGDSGE